MTAEELYQIFLLVGGGAAEKGTASCGVPQTVGFRPYRQLGAGSKVLNPYWKWNLNSSLF